MTNNNELNLAKKVYITKECYDLLRRQKKKQSKSMAKIVCELIVKQYGDETVRKMSGK